MLTIWRWWRWFVVGVAVGVVEVVKENGTVSKMDSWINSKAEKNQKIGQVIWAGPRI